MIGLISLCGRMIVIVDGLDSAEQRKVLQVLETVHALFSDPGAPFIILLAVDPHIIAKAIESNLSSGTSGHIAATVWVGGQAYLRNMVHLPFFLQVIFMKNAPKV
jgi:ankyrin repeat-rich membrane spanning protein